MYDILMRKTYGPPVVMGSEKIMAKKANGTTEKSVQVNLKWNVDNKRAETICCFNRHGAERSGYFMKTGWLKEMQEKANVDEPHEYYDSVTGRLLFTAPIGRTFQEFFNESNAHGWPSFRDAEVNWENVRVLKGGETVSVDGTHLGHNIRDKKGNRYCINLVCVAGNFVDSKDQPPIPEVAMAKESNGANSENRIFVLKKDEPRCTGLFYRSNPMKGDVKVLSTYSDWPRDNAHVQGEVHTVNDEEWIHVLQVKQPNKKKFVKVRGEDVWIPFRHEQYFLEEITE